MDQTLFGEQIANSIIKDNSQLRFLVSKIHVYIVRKRRKSFNVLNPMLFPLCPGVLSFTARNSKLSYKLTKIKQHGQLVYIVSTHVSCC